VTTRVLCDLHDLKQNSILVCIRPKEALFVFTGFAPEALTFLRSLARNNRREWFQPRKEQFEAKIKAPMIELVDAINHELSRFAPEHVNDPRKAIYRIYRDTRFSGDKTPYKTHISAIFPRRGLDRHSGAGFYFEISPKAVGVAGGSYMPGPEQLLAIRTWLSENHAEFVKAAKAIQKVTGKLQGETLQRVPKGFDPSHPAADLIKMKQWYWWTELDPALATTPKLLPEVIKRFRALAEVVAMMNRPLLMQQKRPAFFDLDGFRKMRGERSRYADGLE
jgi:uncharacterized protein (TIGR02453 family)